jgi:hypothetical protein
MDISINIIIQFEQVVEIYGMMFREVKGKKKKQLRSQYSCKEKKNTKKY